MNSINVLSSEIHVKTLSHLDKFSLQQTCSVSHSWCEAALASARSKKYEKAQALQNLSQNGLSLMKFISKTTNLRQIKLVFGIFKNQCMPKVRDFVENLPNYDHDQVSDAYVDIVLRVAETHRKEARELNNTLKDEAMSRIFVESILR